MSFTSKLLSILHLCVLLSIVHAAPTNEPGIDEYENYFNEVDVEAEDADEQTRNAVQAPWQRWPDNTIFFSIADNYTADQAENVRTALAYFNRETCLTFREYDAARDGQQSYVYYRSSENMCGTRVGYRPSEHNAPHDVHLNPKCLSMVGVIQHETLHVLGLYHEQSRPDRNKYVSIEYSNIAPKYWTQFMSYPEPYTTTFDVPYDYESLMHYPANAFATDPSKPTMRAIENGEHVERKMGTLKGPSEGDLTKIRIMYKCN